jgi:hypothetical protein
MRDAELEWLTDVAGVFIGSPPGRWRSRNPTQI